MCFGGIPAALEDLEAQFAGIHDFLMDIDNRVTQNTDAIANNVDNVDDADNNPANELQTLQLIGNTLSISSGNQVELPNESGSIGAIIVPVETCTEMGTSAGSTLVGWCPNGSSKTEFTIQVDSNVSLPALIPISLDNSSVTDDICSVTDQGSEFFGKFFVITCSSAPHSTANLQYAIITS